MTRLREGNRWIVAMLGSWFKILPTRDFKFCVVCHIKDFLGMLPQGTFWEDCHIGLSWSVATWDFLGFGWPLAGEVR